MMSYQRGGSDVVVRLVSIASRRDSNVLYGLQQRGCNALCVALLFCVSYSIRCISSGEAADRGAHYSFTFAKSGTFTNSQEYYVLPSVHLSIICGA